ncbi:syntaxin-binding protein 5 [Eurytemora carolleeae]|uniref:syntaxin-binding protein 5 n=1 Tax=Eurytemora carolleeae TaxID=1294199 RepID=UPI000C780FDE|nr:syntaxin-binding protein 5 [Eurytemora carolleeae]|eukprot:XP_023338537.1 syntaxin-binding protein 5-like [Eurytemora affinis]
MSSLKMKKFPTIKGVFENIRGSVSSGEKSATSWFTSLFSSSHPDGIPARLESEIIEALVPDYFRLEKTSLHGFPFKPTAAAFDPVQKVLAIGNRHGSVRLLGRPGLDITFHHDSRSSVIQLLWLVNTGQLISACCDDTIYLWDVRKSEIELLQSLRFNRESITCIYSALRSKWMYVGTDKGNVHVMNLDSFSLSGYSISWNKAIDMMQKTHPGCVTHLSENPADSSKLLIGFETGSLCLWDLSNKKGDQRYSYNKKFTSVSWHWEGRQFVCSCSDGSLVTWQLRPTAGKPSAVIFPHKKKGDEVEDMASIDKVEWVVSRDGESYFIFSGGLPQDVTGAQPSITVMQGKNVTVLEMEFCVLDFLLITDSVYRSEISNPESILVLLTNDLVAIDCRATGLPSYENPYAMDFQAGWSGREWPVSGGVETGKDGGISHFELVVTGHADGSVRFWDASSNCMQALCRLRTQKLFEKNKNGKVDVLEEDPYAITGIVLSQDCKQLLVAGQTAQVILFKFGKKDGVGEVACLEIPIIYEVKRILLVFMQKSFNYKHSAFLYFSPLKVRAGQLKKPAGYQPELTCLTPWVNTEPPSPISCLTLNPVFGLLAYGNGSGLVIVDFIQQKCLLNMGTADLYGSNDPYQRMPRSPRLLPASPSDDVIVKVDLSNYSQVTKSKDEEKKDEKTEENGTPKENLNVTLSTGVKAKNRPRPLQKAGTGSSAEENSLSKSRSSSVGSMDQIVEGEGVTALHFGTSFPNRLDFELSSCLFIGTSLGSILIIVIQLPETGELRESDPVIVSPSCSLLKLRSAVLEMGLLDSSFSLMDRPDPPQGIRHTSRAGQGAPATPQATPQGDQQVLAVCTEKGVSVFALPSQRLTASSMFSEGVTGIRSSILSWGGAKMSPLILIFTSDGGIKGFSLPSLRPMIESNLVSVNSPRISRTLRFSTGGNGVYFTNPNQIQKFSVNAESIKSHRETCGKLFQDNIEMPEAPKQGFLKGLFGGGPKPLDREELFGESSGKASSSLAKTIPGAKLMDLQGNSGGATSEVAKAKQAICERGQKLNEIEDRTEMMSNEAKIFADNSHNMMLHFKNKKWYQL